MRFALTAAAVAFSALALAVGVLHAAPYASGVIERPAEVGGPAGDPRAVPPAREIPPDRSPSRVPRPSPAGPPVTTSDPLRPRLALVIDDLGPNARAARRVLDLPGPVACAVLPGTANAAFIANAARAAGREVLVHLPMRAPRGSVSSPFLLDVGMDATAIAQVLDRALLAVPGAVGVNNHQGSTLTAQAEPMAALMRALAGSGLWFLDSRTTPATVAAREAARAGVPVLERQVFLDNDPAVTAVRAEFARAVALARRHGQALAIGHPHPATLAVLTQELARLRDAGVELVAPSALLAPARPSHSLDTALTGR